MPLISFWHLVRDEGRHKRGRAVSTTDTPSSQGNESELGQILSRDPTPEFAAQLAEEYEILLDRLAWRV